MNESDQRPLAGTAAKELADIGISRSDLPRLYAECAFGSYFYDAFICDPSLAAESKLDCSSPCARHLPGEFHTAAAANPLISLGETS